MGRVSFSLTGRKGNCREPSQDLMPKRKPPMLGLPYFDPCYPERFSKQTSQNRFLLPTKNATPKSGPQVTASRARADAGAVQHVGRELLVSAHGQGGQPLCAAGADLTATLWTYVHTPFLRGALLKTTWFNSNKQIAGFLNKNANNSCIKFETWSWTSQLTADVIVTRSLSRPCRGMSPATA